MFDETENRIVNILNKIKGPKEIEIKPEMNLFSAGVLDSFGMIEYLSALEKEFDIKIVNEDLVPQNLWNVKAGAILVGKYLGRR